MAWGNAVLSENQNDVEACLTKRGYEADISTRAIERQAMSSKGVNTGFENMVGVTPSSIGSRSNRRAN